MPNPIVHRPPRVQDVRAVSTRMTVEVLQGLIRELGPAILDGRHPRLHLTVDGYGDDPRELWEIPEVRQLLERVISTGLIGLLAMNFEERDPLSLGVVDIYLFARGRAAEGGFLELDVGELRFIVEELLPAAYRTVEQVLGRGG